MPKITVALICHNDLTTLKHKFWEMSAWTRQPDEILVLHNGIEYRRSVPGPMMPPRFIACQDRDDKGYEKRAIALDEATGDFILWANYDDIHDLHILERMAPTEDDVVVHCLTTGKYGNRIGMEFIRCSSGAENFLVRTDYARSVGGYWDAIARTDKGDVQADKKFIDALSAGTRKIRLVNEVLVIQL